MAIAEKLILPLPRPQYVPVPEALISALAWRAFDVDWDDSGPVGLVYRLDHGQQAKQPKSFVLRLTEPQSDLALKEFGEALKASGLKTLAAPDVLARAVLNSVVGVRAERSGKQSATPIAPGLALLQNMRGLLGANPPDMGQIMEMMYRLGDDVDPAERNMTKLWLEASQLRLRADLLLQALDNAVDAKLLDAPRQIAESDRTGGLRPNALPGTPYSWLAKSWNTLTSPEWVGALPARVWVDWATTVLRLGLGMGFLWEAKWYESVARRLLRDDESPSRDKEFTSWLIAGVGETLPWKSSRSMTSVRDVAPILSWRIHRGDNLRRLLTERLGSLPDDEPLSDSWDALRADREFMTSLTEALASKDKGANNTWEAVKYALVTRDATGPSADYYGLLKSSGRYMVVDPGTEWIAVVASLACGKPGQAANVGAVMHSLMELGMQPELNDLVALLERAGLARGSADADQAVIVQSAFSGGAE